MSPHFDDDRGLRALLELDDDALSRMAQENVGAFLEAQNSGGPAATTRDAAHPSLAWLADGIPGYHPLREIGRGGMGMVFEAIEESTGRVVALKIPHAHLRGEEVSRRFDAEATALARIDHDGVARLYGVVRGQGPLDGTTVLVMERIYGVPLDVWSKQDRDLRTRVRLIRDIADAIDAAHKGGVLHLDLKPSNVIVREDGAPKVLDFGIAHTLAGLSQDSTLTLVTHGFGTLDVIAPEQVDARMAGPVSDVYALGSLLYQVISGSPPLDLRGLPFSVAAMRIQHESPAPLRSRVRGIPRDLEVIASVALAKSPSDRYPSAAAIRDDLDRWLAGRPILAKPASPLTKSSLFVRRHMLGVAATASVVALLSIAVVVSLKQAASATAARDRAELRADELADLARLIAVDTNKELLTIDGTTTARITMIERGLAVLKNLAAARPSDDQTVADLLHAYCELGNSHGSLGSWSLGDVGQALKVYSEGIDIGEEYLPGIDGVPSLTVAQLIRLYSTRAYNASGYLGEAPLEDSARIRVLAERMVREVPSDPAAYANLVRAKSWLLLVNVPAGDVSRLAELESALEEGNRYLDRFPGNFLIRQQLWPMLVLVGLQRSLLLDASALELLNAAIAAIGVGDVKLNHRPIMTRADFRSYSLPLAYRAVCHAMVFGDAAAARDDYGRAIALIEGVLAGEPDDPMSARRLAHVLGAAALAEAELAKHGAPDPEEATLLAESFARRAVDILEQLVARGAISQKQAETDGDLALRVLRDADLRVSASGGAPVSP